MRTGTRLTNPLLGVGLCTARTRRARAAVRLRAGVHCRPWAQAAGLLGRTRCAALAWEAAPGQRAGCPAAEGEGGAEGGRAVTVVRFGGQGLVARRTRAGPGDSAVVETQSSPSMSAVRAEGRPQTPARARPPERPAPGALAVGGTC